MPEISFLLGAGFSADKGYPTVNRLNRDILNLKREDIFVTSDGILILFPNKQNYGGWMFARDFIFEMIHFYDEEVKPFNYEEFFDYYKQLTFKYQMQL